MNDCLELFEQYKDFNAIAELHGEIKKLREYYVAEKYNEMKKFVGFLMMKYSIESAQWTWYHHDILMTNQQVFFNADTFLQLVGLAMLKKRGIDTNAQLSQDENAFINSITKPKR